MPGPISTATLVKPGDTIEGRYRVIRALDEGGMGTVFLAEHVLIKRRVAVKLLRPDFVEDADVLERFMNEARAAGTLGHPNIVESTDMGFTRDGLPYIVFEYLEGSLLTDEIYRVKGFAVRRAIRIARQIASALIAAHAAGLVHRDLKTDNVFLTDREGAFDHVKVLDFGVASFLDAKIDEGRERKMIGTPQFMAPEQIEAPETVDQRADIYGLGLILYEMVAARRAFASDTNDALFQQILTQPPPPLGIPGTPEGFEDMLFDKFLAKRPGDRFQTMKDVEAALDHYAALLRPTSGESQPIPIQSQDAWPSDPAVLATAAIALPPVPPARSSGLAWLVASLALLGAGTALAVTGNPGAPIDQSGPALQLLQGNADSLSAAIDSVARSAQLRASSFVQSPQLRAAAETDAKTVRDMMGSDFALTTAPGEVFELFIRRDAAVTPLLVTPDGPPLAIRPDDQPRLHATGNALAVVVTAMMPSQHAMAGGVALSVPIDLSEITHQLGEHATAVSLTGLETAVPLVAGPEPAGARVTTLPLHVMHELGVELALRASRPPPAAPPQSRLGPVRIGCWVVGGLLAMGYLVNLIRARRRG